MFFILVCFRCIYIYLVSSGAIDGDDDNYGMEMRTYLNEDDVIKPGDGNRLGIQRYFTPTTGPSTSRIKHPGRDNNVKRKLSDKSNKESEAQLEPQRKQRRSAPLPSFSSDEDFVGSDDELPEFDVNRVDLKKMSPQRAESCQSWDVVMSDSEHAKDVKKRKITSLGDDVGNKEMNNKSMKGVGNKEMNNKSMKGVSSNINKKQRKKKKDEAASVIELITDQDSDFEQTTKVVPETETIDVLSDAEMDQTGVVQNESSSEESDKNMEVEEESNELSQLFPTFTPDTALLRTTEKTTCAKKRLNKIRVKTPPSHEEVASMLDQLDTKERLSPIDLLDLVDKWEKEGCLSPESSTSSKGNRSLNLTSQLLARSSQKTKCKTSVSEMSVQVNVVSNESKAVVTHKANNTNVPTLPKKLTEVSCTFSSDEEFDQLFDFQNLECKGGRLSEPFSEYIEQETTGDKVTDNIDDGNNVTKTNDSVTFEGLGNDSDMLDMLADKADTSSPRKSKCDMIEGPGHKGNSSSDEDIFNKASHKTTVVHDVVESRMKTPQPHSMSTPLPGTRPKSSLRSAHDSFFGDDLNDSVFAAVQTPFSLKKGEELTQKVTSNSSSKTLDTSHFTFTQALKCVDSSDSHQSSEESEGFDVKSSSIKQVSSSPVHTAQQPLPSAGPQYMEHTLINQAGAPEISEPKLTVDNSNVMDAQFDLGFDLDDFDDSFVIPPSPPASGTQPFSQRSQKLSGTATATNNCANIQRPEKPKAIKSLSLKKKVSPKSDPTKETSVQKLDPQSEVVEDALNKNAMNTTIEWGDESQSILELMSMPSTSKCVDQANPAANTEKENCQQSSKAFIKPFALSTVLSREANQIISSQISSQIKQDAEPPVAVVGPTLCEPAKTLETVPSKPITPKFSDSLFDDTFSNIDFNDEKIVISQKHMTRKSSQGAEKDIERDNQSDYETAECNDTKSGSVCNQMEIETLDPGVISDDDFFESQKIKEGTVHVKDESNEISLSDLEDNSDDDVCSPVLTLTSRKSKLTTSPDYIIVSFISVF